MYVCMYYLWARKSTSTYVVQFIVESARVADRFAVLISSPQSRRRRRAVGAARARPSGRRLQFTPPTKPSSVWRRLRGSLFSPQTWQEYITQQTNLNKLCGRPPQYAPSRLLQIDL